MASLITKILAFVFQNTAKKEIVLSLSAPKDFLYKEAISFEIKDTDIAKEKVVVFLEEQLKKDLILHDGKIIFDDENPSTIHISIPFKLNELGNRRHYRLPDISMLGKKVLVICESQQVAQSIQKMFKYFLYDIDVGYDEYKKSGSNLMQYDILLIEEKLITEEFEDLVAKVQEDTSLKYVLLENSNNHSVEEKNSHIASAHLVKPVLQESIYELIISLFSEDTKNRNIRVDKNKIIINIENYINKNFENSEERFIKKDPSGDDLPPAKQKNKSEKVVLDIAGGEKNAKQVGLSYKKELKKFLEHFDHSDIYFRQIVSEKSTWQIKEFCKDLEKWSKVIGAQRMLNFADEVSLLFVYDKLDTLPLYTAKYHVELKKLIMEINHYLSLV
ncbi:MAG: hypothetical protein P794_02790 [Epsilonproteobacteria bacterium (ex Lamellibrachia satsuma)]|nr:MAG: hypothetical protein P794_02790 [Epsilonproteobacteria bacterium (ex Lamellibrachia satsuma)]